jgi:hypothetical protein
MGLRNVGKSAFAVRQNPGPASYNVSKITDSKSPAYTMGTKRSKSPDDSFDIPGPGSYDQVQKPTRTTGGYKFGISKLH